MSNSHFATSKASQKRSLFTGNPHPCLWETLSAFLVSLPWNTIPKTMRKAWPCQVDWHAGAISATGRQKVLNIWCFAFLNISLILISHLCTPRWILAAKCDLILKSPLWRPSTHVRSSSLHFLRKPSVQETIRLPRLMTSGGKKHCLCQLNLSSELFFHAETMKLQE